MQFWASRRHAWRWVCPGVQVESRGEVFSWSITAALGSSPGAACRKEDVIVLSGYGTDVVSLGLSVKPTRRAAWVAVGVTLSAACGHSYLTRLRGARPIQRNEDEHRCCAGGCLPTPLHVLSSAFTHTPNAVKHASRLGPLDHALAPAAALCTLPASPIAGAYALGKSSPFPRAASCRHQLPPLNTPPGRPGASRHDQYPDPSSGSAAQASW